MHTLFPDLVRALRFLSHHILYKCHGMTGFWLTLTAVILFLIGTYASFYFKPAPKPVRGGDIADTESGAESDLESGTDDSYGVEKESKFTIAM